MSKIYFFIPIVLYIIISTCLHSSIYNFSKKIKKDCKILLSCIFKKVLKLMKTFIIFILSPDYYFALLYKNKYNLPSQKKLFTLHIKRANMINLIISSSFFIILTMILQFLTNDFVINLIIVFLLYRIISRSIEIILAFGNDVVKKEYVEVKKSFLDKYDRIILAIKSLLELIILNTLVYSLLSRETCINQIVNAFIYSIGTSFLVNIDFKGYTEPLIFSFNWRFVLFNAIVILQVITSFVLIVLAIARYLSDTDTEKAKELGKDNNDINYYD